MQNKNNETVLVFDSGLIFLFKYDENKGRLTWTDGDMNGRRMDDKRNVGKTDKNGIYVHSRGEGHR